jgi:hypothetical protein
MHLLHFGHFPLVIFPEEEPAFLGATDGGKRRAPNHAKDRKGNSFRLGRAGC